MENQIDINKLSFLFSRKVKEELKEHLDEINHLNASPDYKDYDLCATGEFCDSNMLMDEAFKEAFGREIDTVTDQGEWSGDWYLINSALAQAKNNNFKY